MVSPQTDSKVRLILTKFRGAWDSFFTLPVACTITRHNAGLILRRSTPSPKLPSDHTNSSIASPPNVKLLVELTLKLEFRGVAV